MDLRDLRYFETIAELQHLGRASTRLHRTQPALTSSIRRLEAACGAALFEKAGRGIRLTEAGLRAVSDDYRAAGAALGLPRWMLLRNVLLPEATPALAAALRLVLTRTDEVSEPIHVLRRRIPLSRLLDHVRRAVRETGTCTFDDAVKGLNRTEQAAAFWAVLDLIRGGEVTAEQDAPFAPIRMRATGRQTVSIGVAA